MGHDEIRQVGHKPLQNPNTTTNKSATLKGLQLDEIKTHKWTILPCSAMTGKNLQEGLDWVVKDAQERLFLY